MSVKVIFLGTNGWYNSPTGDTTCILIETKDSYIILDAGSGIAKLDQYIKKPKKAFLFMSHFHIDHVHGLHILNKFIFPHGLTICCYEGGGAILNQIVNQPFTIGLKDLPYQVTVRELEVGENKGFPFKVFTADLVHSSRCFGYRFEINGKIITLCTDTGYCPTALELSRGADLLMAECAYKEGQVVESWPHLNPELAAKLAKDAGVKKLALMHFDAENYQTLSQRAKAKTAAQKVFKNTVAAKDGMTVAV